MRRLLAAAALLLLAACGSTVPVSNLSTGQNAAGQDLSGQGLSGEGGSSNAVPGTPGADVRTIPGSGAAGTLPATVPTIAASTGGSVAGPVRKAPIRVALMYPSGVGEAAAAIGLAGLSIGDAPLQAHAEFDYINSHGGIGGRQVVVSDYAIKTSTSSNPETDQAAACAAFRDDLKVKFVVSMMNLLPGFTDCTAKAGIAVIDDQGGLPDSDQSRVASYYSAPGDVALGRRLKLSVDAMWATGWLNAKSVVGSFSYDVPSTQAAVKSYLIPALAAHGLTLTVQQSVSNSASGISQASAAVVKYRASKVDVIIPTDASPLFLMNGAQNQGYHPKYLMASSFGPGALFESSAPQQQLHGSSGIGWSPYLDIGKGKRPVPVSSTETLCHQIIKSVGEDSTSATTTGLQLDLCNVIFFLKYAGDLVPAATDGELGLAIAKVGVGYRPADTFKADLSHHVDGMAAYHVNTFMDSCECYQYVGGLHSAA